MIKTALLKERPSTIVEGEVVITVQVDGVWYDRLNVEASEVPVDKARLRGWYRDRGYEVIG